jgi:hypothetical protein
MDKGLRELNYDSTSREEDFNKFYDEFFQVKMLRLIKDIKIKHYRCASTCFTDQNIDDKCLNQCEQPHLNFFKHVENVLKPRLENFYSCTEKCPGNNDPVLCTETCITATIETLNQIEPEKEFKKFISA